MAAEIHSKVALGTGRRKTAVARCRLTEGNGTIKINGREVEAYFTEEKDRSAVVAPLVLADMRNRLNLTVTVRGGGFTGQAGAIRQGVARALKVMFNLDTTHAGHEPAEAAATANGEAGATPEKSEGSLAVRLRESGYLTRDGRMKERKKYGRKGARKSFQFSKR